MAAVIETFELTKEFRHPFFTWLVRARAVVDLTLRVERGEVFGLLGPNGSGKTTTIKLLLGLLFPSRGQAALFGRAPDEQVVKERVGFLPEESYLYRFLDAEETLDFYGRLFGLPRRERRRRTEALLRMVGLWRERRRPVAEFSKGMQRRIGIAQSLVNDPELLILDEPTTGLDPIGTSEIKELIRGLKDKGKTVLVSSHLLADMEQLCDRAAVLYGGRLRACGPLAELLRDERRVQITAEMDEDTVAAVVGAIRARAGSEARIEVSAPLQRLEQFFLRVVAQASDERAQTSGARLGRGEDLDFLTPAREDDLIGRLARGEEEMAPAGARAAAAPRPALDDPAPGVLRDLVRTEAAVEPAVPAPAAGEADAGGKATDRGLLDQLVQGDE